MILKSFHLTSLDFFGINGLEIHRPLPHRRNMLLVEQIVILIVFTDSYVPSEHHMILLNVWIEKCVVRKVIPR
jgi:hypothetical protein